ncbi:MULTISPECIES: lipocalin family protein [Flavobacteriaceae]|uniref:lipocalin family protein n=1 Tax=Flavobacteriaceae TaxID=49546 RepID=UPI0014914A56|nr:MULTISPECIES: lipocalin family protein [Allomuricauda]MDC6365360.1 lipocalin family protein [Muricauda sp. AC10]
MRKTFTYFFALFFLFISCSTDSETPEENPEDTVSLIGTWYFILYLDDEGEEPATECDGKDYLTFKEDGSFDYGYHYIVGQECENTGGNQTGAWSYITDKVIELDYGNNDTYEVPFSIEDNVLTLTLDEGEGEYQEKYEKEE